MYVIFTWKKEDFEYLLKSCDKDEATPYMLRHLPKSGKIVEAGCGLGRFVKYLSDKGYDIEGIEYSEETVRNVKKIAPELNIIQGDIINMPYRTESVDGIVSLGVIEHFISGCNEPLKEMYRVLKYGGIAIITVPSFNLIRKIKTYLYINEIGYFTRPIRMVKQSNTLRRILGRKTPAKKLSYNRNQLDLYNIWPTFGDFFEYRLTKKEFEDVLLGVGFRIIESTPIAHMDGIYHEFSRLLVSFRNWEFSPSIIGTCLNRLLSKVPFCHNHMHLCVVRKESVIPLERSDDKEGSK